MDHFLDQAARILASELPRRQALKRLGGLVAGGILATLGVPSAYAQGCKGNQNLTSCPGNPSPPFCVTNGKCACGTKKCNKNDTCCPGNGIPFCATKGKPTCCGTTSCKTDETCCGSKCCKSNQACSSDGKCVASKSKGA